jgi:hypothetical protein
MSNPTETLREAVYELSIKISALMRSSTAELRVLQRDRDALRQELEAHNEHDAAKRQMGESKLVAARR